MFEKAGRNLVLSDTGRMVFNYADEMFRIAGDLLLTLTAVVALAAGLLAASLCSPLQWAELIAAREYIR